MSSQTNRRRGAAVVGGALLIQSLVLGAATFTTSASAADLPKPAVEALDQVGGLSGARLVGDSRAVAVLSTPLHGFPTQGSTALILSTGDASVVADSKSSKTSTKTQHGDDAGTVLKTGSKSADGNDLTQVELTLDPPSGTTCVGFDFMFLTEEYPRYKGKKYNDIFTAELNTTAFTLKGSQVESASNFALSSDKEVLSLNTFSKFVKAPKSSLNGRSEQYTATSPLDPKTSNQKVFLTVQDLGDSYLDSAVVVDNLRYLTGAECAAGTESKVDTDGDGIPDIWETNGIDIDKDGIPELDLPAIGTNPLRKDVLVEIDWMKDDVACTSTALVCAVDPKRDETPRPEAIAAVVKAFADAPVSNPDGSTGITLHVDAGPNSPKADGTPWGARSRGGQIEWVEEIGTYSSTNGYDWAQFDSLQAKNTDNVRSAVFRYAIFANAYAGEFKSSGYADMPGKRLMVTSHDWAWPIIEESGTFMHELGHNIGLNHGGADGTNRKEGYYSLMNYDFQMKGVDTKGKLDFSTGRQDYKIPLDPAEHGARANAIPALDTFSDWNHLKYDGRGIGSLGASAPAEAGEQHVEDIDLADVSRGAGSAGIEMYGPTLVAKGVDSQVLIADITNHSDVDSSYRIALDVPWLKGQLPVEVPAGKTQRVAIPVTVDQASDGAEPVKASLFHDKELMATSTVDVNAVDLSDETVAATVRETMEELVSDPVPGLDADIIAALDDSVASAVDVDLSEAKTKPRASEESSSLPLPAWALGLIGAAVLAAVGMAARLARRKG